MAHYINNQEFYHAIIEYKEKLKTNPTERVPEYIGKCILDIARKYSTIPKFSGYSFREEMISDAIENCLLYLTNFDETKYSNPLAYYTQICFYAFLRRIAKEQKQSYIKYKLITDRPVDSFDHQEHDDPDFMDSFNSFIQTHSSFDGESYERKLKKNKSVAKTPLQELMESDSSIEEVLEKNVD
jgi:hypothetical protein